MIIAVDFDGTLCDHRYPNIGKPKTYVIKKLIDRKKNGDQLILWTCRTGEKLKEAVDWCREQGLEFDAVNEDVPEIKNHDFGQEKSVKVYADIYLDDRNITLTQLAL